MFKQNKSGKLGDLVMPAIFIGYAQNQRIYKLWDFNADKAVVSRDVLFDESKWNCSKQIEHHSVNDEIQFYKDQLLSKCFEYGNRPQNSSSSGFLGYLQAMEWPLPNDQTSQMAGRSSSMTLSRRYSPYQKSLGEWWKAPFALLTNTSEISLAYNQATKEEERDSWNLSMTSKMYSLPRKKLRFGSPVRQPEFC